MVLLATGLLVLQSGSADDVRVPPLIVPAHAAQDSLKPNSDVQLLTPGDRIEREVSSHETHSYRIPLTSGQYLHTVIEQSGIDAGGTIYGPNEQKLLEFHCRQRGPTPVSLIADEPGTFRLEISSIEEGSTGRYRLKVESIRLGTAQDKVRIAAERAFADGEQLRTEWKEEAFQKAIDRFEAALVLWKSAGERREEANTLTTIGDVWHSLNESQKALKYYKAALLLSQKTNDRQNESEIIISIGYVSVFLGKNEEALESGVRALKLAQDTRNRHGQAQAFDLMGEAHNGFGNTQRALNSYQEALSIWRDLGDHRGQALALLHCGYAYSDMSDTQKALDAYDKALRLWRSVKNRWGEAHTLTGMGHLKSKLGEKQEALKLYEEARQLFQPMGERIGAGFVLNGMGYVYDELGEPQRALECYEQALQLFRAASYRQVESETLLKIGEIYYSLKDNQKALDSCQRALADFHAMSYQRMESYAFRDIGMIHESQGDVRKALEYYHRALVLNKIGRDQRWQAYVLNNIAHVHEGLSAKQTALHYYNQALLLNRAAGDRFGESNTLYNLARAQRDAGNMTEARSQIERAIELAESLRTNVTSQDLRASYFATARQFYELHVDVLMQLDKRQPSAKYQTAAFDVSERARARSFLELLKEASTNIRQGVDPALLERERNLEQAINTKAERHTQLLANKATAEAQTAAAELNQLTTEYDQVKARIKSESSRYAALTQPQPLSLKEIQNRLLDDNSVLLEYMLGDERSYLWAVTRDEIWSYELPPRAQIEEAARSFRALLTTNQPVAGETLEQRQARIKDANNRFAAESASFSKLVLGPVIDKLGTKRLLIVSDGALQYIPFQALMVPGASSSGAEQAKTLGNSNELIPLLIDHEIVNEPSASALALVLSDTAQRQPAPNSIAVFANPVFEMDDPRVGSKGGADTPTIESQTARVQEAFRDIGFDGGRIPALPASKDEAEAIMAVVPWGTGFKALGFDANRAAITKPELTQYRIVHFATHGFVDYQHPELSGLVLSLVDKDGRPQDGFLRLHDIYNLKLSANLVVLSACNTGLGKEVKGEGLIGLTRGFMYAGAGGVAASLWKVDDDATAELMKHFYEGMFKKGLTSSAALREAQLGMWTQKRWHAPYYWAAFVIQGQYDQKERIGFQLRSGRKWVAVSVALTSMLLLMAFLLVRQRRKRII
jgi:CHAT domain-containing protein